MEFNLIENAFSTSLKFRESYHGQYVKRGMTHMQIPIKETAGWAMNNLLNKAKKRRRRNQGVKKSKQ